MSECAPCDANFWLDVSKQAVTWALVVLGWIVVAWQTDKRQRRSEFKKLVDDCVDEIREIMQAVSKYWPTDPKSDEASQLASEIKARLKRLGLMTSAVSRSKFIPRKSRERAAQLNVLMSNFRQMVTADPFDKADRKVPVAKARMTDIETRGGMLWNELDAIHAAACPP